MLQVFKFQSFKNHKYIVNIALLDYFQMIPDIQIGYSGRDPYLRNENYKRCSRASDTSSAYSGSDMMQSSIDDQENGDSDLPCNLQESLVDSDEEEGYGESTEVRTLVTVISLCNGIDPSSYCKK